jgi:uncharacterized membrane protein YbhN (UPF0104 family)
MSIYYYLTLRHEALFGFIVFLTLFLILALLLILFRKLFHITFLGKRISTISSKIHQGLDLIQRDVGLICKLMGCIILSFSLTLVLNYLLFNELVTDRHVGWMSVCFVIAMQDFARLAAFTPGALGIADFSYIFLFWVINIPVSDSTSVVFINRAISYSVITVLFITFVITGKFRLSLFREEASKQDDGLGATTEQDFAG